MQAPPSLQPTKKRRRIDVTNDQNEEPEVAARVTKKSRGGKMREAETDVMKISSESSRNQNSDKPEVVGAGLTKKQGLSKTKEAEIVMTDVGQKALTKQGPGEPGEAQNGNPENDTETPVKRKRGRPRKNQSAIITPKPTAKRRPGRPKKNGEPPISKKAELIEMGEDRESSGIAPSIEILEMLRNATKVNNAQNARCVPIVDFANDVIS